MKLVKMIKLNNLQYNPNRDPEVYRRPVNKEFRLQVLLNGSGSASVRLDAEGQTLSEATVNLPGAFECKFSFDSPGTRVGTLTIEGGGDSYRQDVRLDVTEHEWIG